MRVEGWSIADFGPITDWSTTGLAGHDVVVVLGPNESGKSALFEFFTSAMFGFSPATADGHPFRPWGGQYPHGRLDVVLRNGDLASVVRRLRARPFGRIRIDSDERDLANRQVPWTGLMDRAVFKNVYALTQDEALRLDQQAWQAVQNLLGGSPYDYLRPSRDIVRALEADRRRLWRSDRRGKPAHRELTDQIRQLRGSLAEAREHRGRIEQADERLRGIASDLESNERRLQRIELALERDRTLAPLVRRLGRLRGLEARAADLAPGGDTWDGVAEERAELRDRSEKLTAQRKTLRVTIAKREKAREVEAEIRRLLVARADVERLDRELSRAQEDRDRIRSMDRELQRSDGGLRELAARALTVEQLDEGVHAAINELSVVELRGRFAAWRDSRNLLDAAVSRLQQLQSGQDDICRRIADSDAALEIDVGTRALLEAREDIERLDRETSRAQENQDRVQSMNAELQRSDGALREVAGRTLTCDQIDPAAGRALLTISVAELRGRFAGWRESQQELQSVSDRLMQLQIQQRETQLAIEERQEALKIEDRMRALLGARADIERLDRELSRAQENQERLASIDSEARGINESLRELSGRILRTEQIDGETRIAVLKLSVGELRGRFASLQAAVQQRAAAVVDFRAAESSCSRLKRRLDAVSTEHSRAELDNRLRELRRIDRSQALIQAPAKLNAAVWLAFPILLGALALSLSFAVSAPEGVLVMVAVAAGVSVVASIVVNRSWVRRRQQKASVGVKARLRRLGLELDADLEAEVTRTQERRDAALRRDDVLEQMANAKELEVEARERVKANENTAESAHEEFLTVVANVPVARTHLEAPDEGLLRDLEEMRLMLSSAERLRRSREAVATRLAAWRGEVERLTPTLGQDLPADPFEAAPAARRALQDALDVERAAEQAKTDVMRLRQELEAGQAQLMAAKAEAGRAAAAAGEAHADFLSVVADVPIAPVQHETPDDGLVRDLEEMRLILSGAERLRRNREAVATRLAAWRGEVERLTPTLGRNLPEDPLAAAPAARRALQDALEVERTAEQAKTDVMRMCQELEAGQAELEAAEAEVERAATAAGEAHAEFLSVVEDVPIAPVQRETPSEDLVRDLEDLRQIVASAQRLRRNRREVATRFEAWYDGVTRLQEKLAIDLPVDPFEAAPAARRALEDALETERIAKIADAEIPGLRQQLETCGEDLDDVHVELERIDASLAAIDSDGTDPEVGLERVLRAFDLRAEARHVLLELERDVPDWRQRFAEAEKLLADGVQIGLSDAERVETRREAEELRQTAQNLADQRGQLTTERHRWMDEPGPAHIMGAITAAEERLDFVRREHDRLALLQKLVQEADTSYRDRYQSPLLSKAGRYLRGFTHDRYDLLSVDDANSSGASLQVRRTGEDFPQDVDTPLSRGTIQQIYFALRLAMVDLVEGDEPLPIFLDEMFVNWDPGRTTSGLAALANMPGDRQVFLFTADPFWAERAVKDVPAHIVRTPVA